MDCVKCAGYKKEIRIVYKTLRELQLHVEELEKKVTAVDCKTVKPDCPSCNEKIESKPKRKTIIGDHFFEVTERWTCEPCRLMNTRMDEAGVDQ